MAVKIEDLNVLKDKTIYNTSNDQYVIAEQGEISFASADYKILGFLNGYTYSFDDDYLVKSTLNMGEIARIAIPALHGSFLEGMNYMYFYNRNTIWKITENLEVLWSLEFDDDIKDIVMDYFGYVYIIYENSRTIRKYTSDGNIVIYFNESDDPSKFCKLYKIFVNKGGGHLYVIGSEFWNDRVCSFVDHYDNRTYKKIERLILCEYNNVDVYNPYFSYHDLYMEDDYIYIYANNYIEKLNLKLRPIWRYGFGYNSISSTVDSLHRIVFDDEKYQGRIYFSEIFDSTQGYSFGKLSTNGNMLWKITSPENITKAEFNLAIYKSELYMTTKKDVNATIDYVLALDDDKVIFETRNGEFVRVIDNNHDVIYSPENYMGLYLIGRKIKDNIPKFIDYYLAHDSGVVVTEEDALILLTEENKNYTNPENYNYFKLLGSEDIDTLPDYSIIQTKDGKSILSFDKSYIETLYPYLPNNITAQYFSDGENSISVSDEIGTLERKGVYTKFFYILADYHKFYQNITTKRDSKVIITKKNNYSIARKKRYVHRYVVKKLADLDLIVEYLVQNGVLDTLLPNYVDRLRRSTMSNLKDMQESYAPVLYNIDAHRVYGYRYDGKEYYLRTPNTMIFMCKNIPYINKRRRDSIFVESMVSLIEKEELTPFLLFVNGLAIKWSNITIIRDWSVSYIVISNCKTYANTLDCILYPCVIRYGEDNNILQDCTTGLYFDLDGFYTTNPNRINLRIEVTDKNISGKSYEINEDYPYLELLEPNEKQTSFPENIITFSPDYRLYADGRFYLDHYGENIYTYAKQATGTTFRSFYYIPSNDSKNMIFDIPNQSEAKNSLKSKIRAEDGGYKVDSFLSPFDFKFSRKKTYDRNVSEAVSYIMTYKMQLLIDYYKNKMNVQSYTFSGSRIKELAASHNGVLIMHRDRIKNLFDYIIVFVNGELYEKYNSIVYTNGYFQIPISNINDNDTVEIIHFRKVNNEALSLTIDKNSEYISEDLRYENFELFGTCPINTSPYTEYSDSAISQCPLSFTSKNSFNQYGNYTGTTIKLDKTYYNGKELRIVSKRQFHYHRHIYSTSEANKIILPAKYKFCYNRNQFIVFRNRTLFTDWSFIHPYSNGISSKSFDMAYINSNVNLTNGDIIDIFYIPDAYEEMHLDPKDSTSVTGYNDIILDTSMLDIPFDKSLFFIYVNGKKINSDDIQNVSINRVRLHVNIEDEGKVTVQRLFDVDNILKEVFSYSDKWTKSVDSLTDEDYGTLFTIAQTRSK